MKLSEFIKELQKVQKKVWDVTITGYDSDYPPVINSTFAKSHWYIEIER